MQPLDVLLKPLFVRVNRTLSETTPARELATDLEGRRFALRIRDSALGLSLVVEDGKLTYSSDLATEPDVVVEGPVSGLVKLATAGNDANSLAGSGVTLTGRADVAQKFQRLLALSKPDPEEELAGLVGDAAAFRISETLKSVTSWGLDAGRTLAGNVSEYLTEERRDLPSLYEMSRFTRDVQTLRDDVERAEARLRQIEARRR